MIATTEPPANLDLAVLPPAPKQLRDLMLATTMLVDGYVEPQPERWHPALEHSLVMPLAGLIIVGTRCSRPLIIREVQNVARAVERDAVIVRAVDAPRHATFDVVLNGVAKPFLGYRLWIAPLSGSTWLIPSGGETSCIRLGTFGLEVINQPPFLDEIDKHRGFRHAGDLLSVAVQGWL